MILLLFKSDELGEYSYISLGDFFDFSRVDI